MPEDLPNHRVLEDDADDLHLAAASRAFQRIHLEHPSNETRPLSSSRPSLGVGQAVVRLAFSFLSGADVVDELLRLFEPGELFVQGQSCEKAALRIGVGFPSTNLRIGRLRVPFSHARAQGETTRAVRCLKGPEADLPNA
jgi:hypothetical protein